MSEFEDVANEILAEIQTALSPTIVKIRYGFVAAEDVTLGADAPVFAMVFNPSEVSTPLPNAQYERVVTYQVVLMRSASMASQMSTDLDAVRDEIQEEWAPATGPLNGLVEQAFCSERFVDDRSDRAKTYGDLTVTTTDVL